MPDNILYIPIQINGGTEEPSNLLDRELYIKNGVLYVGDESGESKVIIGRVLDKTTITNPTIADSLKLDDDIIVSKDKFEKSIRNNSKYKDGRVIMIDEGSGY